MNYKELGNTGVQIPEIGIGTWRYRGGLEPIRAGLSLGAKFIDTAESYGNEELVGEAIRSIRQDVFVATKISPRNFRRAEVRKAVDGSLQRLQTDYIDLYQLHWPNHTVALEETMYAMEELVDRGKVRFIGVSNFHLRELRRAEAAMTKYRIVSNQVRYNLVDRTIESGLLPYCASHGITIIAHSPFNNSFSSLTARDRQDTLGRVARKIGKTVAQVALNWCVTTSRTVAIPKSNSLVHTRENCGASGWKLSTEEKELLEKTVGARRRTQIGIELRGLARHILQVGGREL